MNIHTEVIMDKKKPKVNKYPYIGIYEPVVVLFISKGTGTLLKGHITSDCGMYRTDWDEPRFKKLDTGSTVTLTVE